MKRFVHIGDGAVFGVQLLGNGNYMVALGDVVLAGQKSMTPPDRYVAVIAPEDLAEIHRVLGQVLGNGEQR
jgi:hypothetical protein